MSEFESMERHERFKAAFSTTHEPVAPPRRRRFLELFRPQLQRSVPVEPVLTTTPSSETPSTEATDEQPKTYYFNAAGWLPPEQPVDFDLDDEAD